MIDIRVLGTLEIHQPDGHAPVVELTQPKRVALLLYLALADPPGPQSRDSLMALLWPEADDESARHSLRNALYGLRQALGEAAFVARGEGYVGLAPGAVRCDALEVRAHLAGQRWEEAVAAWGGELAPGFHVSGAQEFERWLEDQRSGLRRAVTDAAWRRVDELERSADAALVPAARRAWSLDPGNEAGARRLMRFLDASVGRTAALRAYEDLADYLRRECEAEPSAETRALAAGLKARIEPGVPPPAPAPQGMAPAAIAPAPPSGAAPRPRRRPAVVAGIAGACLMAGLIAVFALGPAAPARPQRGPDPADSAEPEGVLRLPSRYRRDTASYSSYLRALTLRLQGNLAASRDTFAALVERAPLYAPGLSGLAHVYSLSTVYGDVPAAEGWPKAEAAARRAIALDSGLASAYVALGAVEMFWRWNPVRAGELIDRGVSLEPSDPEAHAVRGVWFRWRGEIDSAVAEARKSHDLDPLNPLWTERLARQLYLARSYAGAESLYLQAMRDQPGDGGPYHGLKDVYLAMGRVRDGLAMWRSSYEVSGDSAGAAHIPVARSEAEAARQVADLRRESLRALQRGAEAGNPIDCRAFAYANALVGDTNETLRWLDSVLARRDASLASIPLDPAFDFVREDPRYQAWEAKLSWRRAPGARR